MQRLEIKDVRGALKGFIEVQPNGDKYVYDFRGALLGFYRQSINSTTDVTGRILARGDISSSLINMN